MSEFCCEQMDEWRPIMGEEWYESCNFCPFCGAKLKEGKEENDGE